jgi:hypothetical protein
LYQGTTSVVPKKPIKKESGFSPCQASRSDFDPRPFASEGSQVSIRREQGVLTP